MHRLGDRIGHYVVISSYDVYAAYEAAWFHRPYPHPLPIPETAPTAATRFLYGPEAGYDKVLVEEAARLTSLRYPALYGPKDTTPREWYYVRQALDRRPVVIAPNGGQAIFSRGYVENVERRGSPGQSAPGTPAVAGLPLRHGSLPHSTVPTAGHGTAAVAAAVW